MKYDFANEIDVVAANTRLAHLIDKQKFVEIKEIREARSDHQNRYMHLLFSLFAIEYGETVEYVKQYFFKEVANMERYLTSHTNKKTGRIRICWLSTKDRDSKELTEDIERFRNWSSKECGIYLPTANEKEFLRQIGKDIERYSSYI